VNAYRLEAKHWVEIGVLCDETEARIEPFSDRLNVASWWL
jgi:hypothetical protein